MKIAIVTMAYNEHVMLPIWVRHYRHQCPGAALFVIDHGSTDGSTRGLDGIKVIPLARSPHNDDQRPVLIASIQRGLLTDHDLVIYTDADEMLLADPRRHGSLLAFLQTTGSDVIAPTGLHMFQAPDEKPLDAARPILGQRRHVWFGAGMCKPTIARVPLRWHPGFHCCDHFPEYRSDLYQFHLATMDREVSLRRLLLTRNMDWAPETLANGHGAHQRISDDEHIRRSYDVPAGLLRQRPEAPFDFDADLRRLVGSIRLVDGFYVPTYFRGTVARVPDEFIGLI